jgi:aldose 1-epimerase
MKRFCVLVIAMMVFAVSSDAKTSVTKKDAGKLPNGASVDLYTLKDDRLEVQVITYGGFVTAIKTPDRSGKVDDVVLGFDEPAGYYENNHSTKASSFGPIIGRYANRIAHATFTLDGNTYHLTKNDGDNTIHGGPNGFSNQLWEGKQIKD